MAAWFNIKLPITMGVERQSERRGGGLRRHSVLAWLRMWRVVQKVERAAAEHLRAYGLNSAQFYVLANVGLRRGACRRSWVIRCSSPRATSATWWTRWSGGG